ncbi:hypothetical protein Sps_03851 [Shewanella psychrophila]|uniref:Uncharacterized protein n=1 Tax=Shewanella psychrophila TaxID=225848 RepID=A0A1S6HTS4_9GAMM|nr:hypothetical protein Sps_03851 [Shewanella psychrophila]
MFFLMLIDKHILAIAITLLSPYYRLTFFVDVFVNVKLKQSFQFGFFAVIDKLLKSISIKVLPMGKYQT